MGEPMTDLDRVEMVRKDCENHARRLDGMEVTGHSLGEMLGGMLASIDCLAAVLKSVLLEIKTR